MGPGPPRWVLSNRAQGSDPLMNHNQEDTRESESDYSRQTVRRRGLRTGYTTGSCAAAAAKAATLSLLSGKEVAQVTIRLPLGRDAAFTVHRCQWLESGESVLCSVIKDGGDDPDVTHGAEICATVSRSFDIEQRVRIVGGPGVGDRDPARHRYRSWPTCRYQGAPPDDHRIGTGGRSQSGLGSGS